MNRRIFHITSATRPGHEPDKVIHNETEADLPKFFAIRIERTQPGTVKSRMNNSLVHISWQTEAEANTCYFELERSSNGRDFETVETVIAVGSATAGSSYGVSDFKYSFFNDKLYYRLKVVLINGIEIFTEEIAMDISKFGTAAVYGGAYSWSQQ